MVMKQHMCMYGTEMITTMKFYGDKINPLYMCFIHIMNKKCSSDGPLGVHTVDSGC